MNLEGRRATPWLAAALFASLAWRAEATPGGSNAADPSGDALALVDHRAGTKILEEPALASVQERLKGYADQQLSEGIMTLAYPRDEMGRHRDADARENEARTLLLRYSYVARGASEKEADQQLMIEKQYGIHTIVTSGGMRNVPSGTPMMAGRVTPDTVLRVLSEHPNLEPRIKEYLHGYLEASTSHIIMTPGFRERLREIFPD